MSAPASYWQRVSEMMDVCGPPSWPSLLASAAELEAAHALVTSSSSSSSSPSTPPIVDPSLLARARYLERASRHPDTGEVIPLPFRMAAHVPVNAVLLVGMLSSRSVAGTAAWQALNQSFNALQFYANRNATNPVPVETVAVSFSAAVVSAVAVGAGLRRLELSRTAAVAAAAASTASSSSTAAAPLWLRALSLSVPFLGAAAAKPLQIGLMRRDELESGVEVVDAEGRARGRSVVAGRTAVGTTVITRITYLAPMLWMPVVQGGLERLLPVLRTNRALGVLSYTAHAAVNSAFVTPLCIALFDQRASLPAEALEADFHGLRDSRGGEVERLFFNKGL
jgi:sideroflexin-5